MTDHDDSNENFLERWSRRKIEADQDASKPAAATSESLSGTRGTSPRVTDENGSREAITEPKPASSAAPAAKAEFDIAKLPSLDSITAATDVRAFLAPGVPAELTRAALRRAWAADPVIRDFVGLAENSWDFTDPQAMAGFGDLPTDFDVKKAIAQLFGEAGEAEVKESATPAEIPKPNTADLPATAGPEATSASQSSPASRNATEIEESRTQVSEQMEAESEFVQSNKNFASQQKRHGRALPQ